MRNFTRPLAVLGLCLFSLLLFLGSWRPEIRPKSWAFAREKARVILNHLGVDPGQAVFFDDLEDFKLKVFCPQVTGTLTTGEIRTLYAHESCHPRGMRLGFPIMDILFFRSLTTESEKHSQRFSKSISEYFCKAGGPQMDRIHFYWYSIYERYSTAEPVVQPVLTFQWDCRAKNFSKFEWAAWNLTK